MFDFPAIFTSLVTVCVYILSQPSFILSPVVHLAVCHQVYIPCISQAFVPIVTGYWDSLALLCVYSWIWTL